MSDRAFRHARIASVLILVVALGSGCMGHHLADMGCGGCMSGQSSHGSSHGSGDSAESPRTVSPDASTPPRVATTPRDATRRFTCSMHPSVVATAPGPCPICGMPLTPVEA